MTRGSVRAPNPEMAQTGMLRCGGSYVVRRLLNEKQQPWEVLQQLLPKEPMVPLTLLLEERPHYPIHPLYCKEDFDYRVFFA